MWGWIAKLLGQAGKKILGKVAEKGAEKVAGATAMKVAQGVAGAAKTAASFNPQNQSLGSKILNVVTGDLGKNFKDTGSMVGRAGELPKGSWFNKLKGFITGDLDEASKKARVSPKLQETVSNAYSQKPITQMGKDPGKLLQFGQELLSGDSFKSKMLLNTLGGLAQQGAFTGSDVGQPDKSFGGMLANSVANALPQSVMQQRRENFDNRQTLLNMAADIDYSQELMQSYQPQMLKQINAFRDEAVNAMANNRKKGINYLKTEDLQDLQWKYVNIKKGIDKFNGGVKMLQDAQSKVLGKENEKGYYSREKFDWAVDQFRRTGEPPAEGFLYPSPKSPVEYASKFSLTDMNKWEKQVDGTMVSPLTDEDRVKLMFSHLNADPQVRAWYEDQGINIDDPRVRYQEATKYASLVEQPVPDYAEAYRYKKSLIDKPKEPKDLGYKLIPDYLGEGKAIVFDKSKTENLDRKTIEEMAGTKLTTVSDVVPVTLERIDQNGNLHLTYKDGDAAKATSIPMSKASGLVDTFYPGASEASKGIKINQDNSPAFYTGRIKSDAGLSTYEVNGTVYNIPSDKVADFLKDYPKAKKVR